MNHQHEWVVFSTALAEGRLMLQCVECGAMGTVDEPSKEEWSEAFHAPSRPYRWADEARVHLRHEPPFPFYVVRTEKDVQKCGCPSRTDERQEREYERFPAEIIRTDEAITDVEKTDLETLAELVRKSDLCSALFPLFIRSYQADTGVEPTPAVKRIARLIEKIDRKGLHCSPAVVARVLREYARGLARQ